MEKIAAGEDLTLLPLDRVLEMLVRETYARYYTSPGWKFPPSGFDYEGDTAGLLKHLIQLAWQAWGRFDYTLYDMSSYRTDVIQDRAEFLDKIMEYEDVDFATVSSAVSAVHQFIKKARYAIQSNLADLYTWSIAMKVDTSNDYDLLDAYNSVMSLAKNNWLQEIDITESGDRKIWSYFGTRDGRNMMGYTNFYQPYKRLTVSFPYRVRSTSRISDTVACFNPQGAKTYIYKNTVKDQRDDSLGDCIECGIGSLAERTQGVIHLDEEWEEEGYPGVTLHGSELLLPEYEDGLGGNISSIDYKIDRAKDIIANGGTVPGYAG